MIAQYIYLQNPFMVSSLELNGENGDTAQKLSLQLAFLKTADRSMYCVAVLSKICAA